MFALNTTFYMINGASLSHGKDENPGYDDMPPLTTFFHFHDKLQWETVREPTCTEEGIQERFCLECNKVVDSETIPMIDHNSDTIVTISEPSCTETGIAEKHCSMCDKLIDTVTLDTVEHSRSDWIVTAEPSCFAEGEQQVLCTVCGACIESEPVPVIDHQEGDWITTNISGCTKYLEKRCVMCGLVMDSTTEEIPVRSDGLSIPSAGISIGLGYVDPYWDGATELAQSYVDAPSYGMYFPLNGTVYIGDHNTQDFAQLFSCGVGTKAYVYGQEITCYSTCYGYNAGTALIMNNGQAATSPGGYILYTCCGSGIYITFWC